MISIYNIYKNCFTSFVQGYCVARKLNFAFVYWVFVVFCAVPSMMLFLNCIYTPLYAGWAKGMVTVNT